MLSFEAFCILMYVKPFGLLQRVSLLQGDDMCKIRLLLSLVEGSVRELIKCYRRRAQIDSMWHWNVILHICGTSGECWSDYLKSGYVDSLAFTSPFAWVILACVKGFCVKAKSFPDVSIQFPAWACHYSGMKNYYGYSQLLPDSRLEYVLDLGLYEEVGGFLQKLYLTLVNYSASHMIHNLVIIRDLYHQSNIVCWK